MESTILILMLVGLGAYLIGSIPSGVIYGKLKGVDIQKTGSGSTGATNVARSFGAKGFAIVFIFDLLKGYVAVVFSMWVVFNYLMFPRDMVHFFLFIGFGLLALVGHSHSIFNGFKGGKGVATSFGIAVAMSWMVALVSIVAFIIVFKKTKTVAIASLSGFVTNTVTSGIVCLIYMLGNTNIAIELYFPLFIGSLIGSIWAFFTHRDNLKRIVNGAENTFK